MKYYTAGYQLVCEVNQTVNVAVALAGSARKLDFEAIKHQEHTELVWKHDGDFEVDEYILERSTDGINFEELSFLPSDSDEKADLYTDFDLSPSYGNNYYRLKLMNKDGGIAYSAVKMVEFVDVTGFTVFPNPANSFTSIDLEKVMGKQVDIHVFNNKGVRMKTFQVDEVYGKYYQMDLRDLQEGHYIIWVNSPNMRPVAKQLVIGRF